MRAARYGFALFLAAAILCLAPAPVMANWTATGRFVYVDREYDQTGFTGVETQRPIRFADVHIVDNKGSKVIASVASDPNGNFSILVVDSSTRTVYARVTTRSVNDPTLWVDVQSNSTGKPSYYAVKGSNVSSHNPNTNVNFGTIVALKGQGGEAFNIFDQMVYGMDYIASLRGSRPGSADDLTALWALNRGVTDSTYTIGSRALNMRDTAGYDDTVILHEMGHYEVFEFSASDSPLTGHTFSDCNADIRLAYDEGHATYFGNSVLRFNNFPRCNIYTRTNGGPGPGNLVRYADVETDAQYLCQGSTSELNVAIALWDINDSASTTDTTPGVEDAGDALALPDAEPWQVQTDYMTTAVNKSLEDFWDGWFKAPISNGFPVEMRAIFTLVATEFWEDGNEVNNTAATASPITIGGGQISATFFYDPDGDQAGQADTDYYVFSAGEGQALRAQTTNLLSDANTFLEILDTDGSTVLASSSSLIDWTAPRSDAFYLRLTHAADWGIYGSYKVQLDPL